MLGHSQGLGDHQLSQTCQPQSLHPGPEESSTYDPLAPKKQVLVLLILGVIFPSISVGLSQHHLP